MLPTNEQRLSQISTMWTMLIKAHGGASSSVEPAQHALLECYGGAVYRYLLGATRDAEAAAELSQEFVVRFLRGDFRRADPGRGRFRDYLKTALIHLVTDYQRERQKSPQALPADLSATDTPSDDDPFLASWRAELLDRTWDALADSNPTEHALLLARVANPDLRSAELAAQVGAQLNRPLNAAAARKALQRSHASFAELLVQEVKRTLGMPTLEQLEAELRDLNLLQYCRTAIDRSDPTKSTAAGERRMPG